MSKPKGSVGRRGFLKGAAAGAASFAAAPVGVAQQPEPRATAETRVVEVTGNEKPGSDFMVDVLKTPDIEYCAANPGSSFRGLQESCINYGGNKSPWVHSVQDAASMMRDFVKWDDTPVSLGHFAESAVRAYKIAMTDRTVPDRPYSSRRCRPLTRTGSRSR
jgi:hypothetical protein